MLGWPPNDSAESANSVAWDCDAAQTVVVGILASLRTKELLRSHVVAVRIRADESVVVTGFCAGGKAGRRHWWDISL